MNDCSVKVVDVLKELKKSMFIGGFQALGSPTMINLFRGFESDSASRLMIQTIAG